jgi:cation transport ATPase
MRIERGSADAVDLARRIDRTIRQDLAWAFGDTTLMIPLAVAGPPAGLGRRCRVAGEPASPTRTTPTGG